MRNEVLKQFKFLKRGDKFTFDGDNTVYVKLGNHGGVECVDDRLNHDKQCVPALYDQCKVIGNVADGVRFRRH